jgi:hypothetical protein
MSANRDRQAVGNLQPPQIGHHRAGIGHLVEQRADGSGRLVVIDPGQRR